MSYHDFSLLSRSVTPLPSPWVSSEIDTLEELLTESLVTLERLDQFSTIAKEITATLDQLTKLVGQLTELVGKFALL